MDLPVVVIPLEMAIPSVACRVQDGVLYVYVDERTDPEHVRRVIDGMKAILEVTEPTTQAPPAEEEGPPTQARPPLLTTRPGQLATGGALLAGVTATTALLLLPPQPATPRQAVEVPSVASPASPPRTWPGTVPRSAPPPPVALVDPAPASGRTAAGLPGARPARTASTSLVVSPPPAPPRPAPPSCRGLLCLLDALLAL